MSDKAYDIVRICRSIQNEMNDTLELIMERAQASRTQNTNLIAEEHTALYILALTELLDEYNETLAGINQIKDQNERMAALMKLLKTNTFELISSLASRKGQSEKHGLN